MRRSIGHYAMAFLFFFVALLCVIFVDALFWGKDYPNLQSRSNFLCFIGIITWMIFIIVGWAQDCFGKDRWRLIVATVLAIMDSVLFWFGYNFASLVFTTLFFLILGLYFFPSMDDIPRNQPD